MGAKAREILTVDLNKLRELLNKAYADEWLVYYQYWIGAQVVQGPMRDAAIKELMEHAGDELHHAQMLANRIIQLGGTPILSPQGWYTASNCGYQLPEDPYVKNILQQNIAGERCAIDVYDALMKFTKDGDLTTYHLAEKILSDELEHEEDLENLLLDLHLMSKKN